MPEFAPFIIALIVMLALGVLELLSQLIGFSPSTSLESALPGMDVDADVPDGAGLGPLSQMLGWLSVGKLPLLVLLVVFFTSFGLAG